MVFCPTCGAELTANEKFCKYCGSEIGLPATEAPRPTAAPVAPAPSPASQPSAGAAAGAPKKKKMKKIGIVVLVLLTISGASYGILVAATWGTYDQTVPFAYYASGADYDNITLSVDVSIADINVTYIDPMDGAPLVQGAYEQHIVGSLLGEIEFTKSQLGKDINVAQTFAVVLFATSGYCRVNIQLLKNTTYTINAETGTGNVLLVGTDVETADDVTIEASTGNVNVTFTNVNVTGSLVASASTGNVVVALTRCKVTGNTHSDTSTGNVLMALTQCNVTGNAHSDASTGNVNVTLTDTYVGGNFEFSTSTGNLGVKLVNLTTHAEAYFWANCSTGNLRVEFEQRVELMPLGGIMRTHLETSTGNIAFYYRGLPSLSTGLRATASSSTGFDNLHAEAGFSTVSGNYLETDGYVGTTSKIEALTVQASTGNVDVYALSLT